MVVHNFYVVRVSVVPDKAHTILIVNPDAVLAFAAVLQSLEPVSRRTAQERKRFGAVQLLQLSLCNRLKAFELTGAFSVEKQRCCFVFERLNHGLILYQPTLNATRYSAIDP